jgi:ABC-type phosphate/phosphonate transport system substrate-binding protein
MIAALPMYDFPELRQTTDAFWQGLRRHFAAAGLTRLPTELTHPADIHAHWLAGDLLFSQTCGFPLTHALKGRVRYLATPCYSAPGCAGSSYRSFIIVREEDSMVTGAELGCRVAAFNSEESQSGSNVLKHYLTGRQVAFACLPQAIESGSHRASVALVREGRADFCAVDCVSWALLAAVAPGEVAGLRILDETAAAPALPYITGLDRPVEDVAALRGGLAAAFADPELAEIRSRLLLEGVVVLDESAYDVISEQETAAGGLTS